MSDTTQNFADASNPDSTLRVKKQDLFNVDSSFIVPREQQPGFIGRFMINQAGGFPSKYYTKDDTVAATRMVGLKFASVSLATFSAMKMLEPAFNSDLIQSLPPIGTVDPKLILMGGVGAFTWWGISKIDTAVIHQLRSQKAAEITKRQTGSCIPGSDKPSYSDYFTRLGISFGSLIISVPILNMTIAEEKIDKALLDRLSIPNNAIIEEYKGKLTTVEDEIKRLTGLKATLGENLRNIDEDNDEISYTDAQAKRLEVLKQQETAFETRKTELLIELEKEERNRIEAEQRIRNETQGVKGSVAGCEVGKSPLCQDAIADRDDALQQIERIKASIDAVTNQNKAVLDEMEVIENTAIEALKREQMAESELRRNIASQLEVIESDLTKQRAEKPQVEKFNELAQADPRYQHFKPDFSTRAEAYYNEVITKANPIEWAGILGLTLMITCAELAVFLSSARRPANSSEVNAYKANMAKIDASKIIYERTMELVGLHADIGMDDNIVDMRHEKRVREEAEKIFESAMETALQDPELLDEKIAELKEKLRRNSAPKKNSGNGPSEPNPSP